MPHATFQKVYFPKFVVGTEFRRQTLGIDTFPFPCIAVPTPQHGNEIPMSLYRNYIPMSLHGNEIPTKCRGNEIPTNHLSELYTIYNPASCRKPVTILSTESYLLLLLRNAQGQLEDSLGAVWGPFESCSGSIYIHCIHLSSNTLGL